MITSNGADSIQLLSRKYGEKKIELKKYMDVFITKTTTKDMLQAKTDMDRAMLELIQIKTKIDYIEKGWK